MHSYHKSGYTVAYMIQWVYVWYAGYDILIYGIWQHCWLIIMVYDIWIHTHIYIYGMWDTYSNTQHIWKSHCWFVMKWGIYDLFLLRTINGINRPDLGIVFLFFSDDTIPKSFNSLVFGFWRIGIWQEVNRLNQHPPCWYTQHANMYSIYRR